MNATTKRLSITLKLFLFSWVLASLVLSSCATPTPPPTVIEKVTEEFKGFYNDAAQFYASYAALDAKETEVAGALVNKFQQLTDQNKDDYFLVKSCFSNSEDFVVAITTSAYGPEGLGGTGDSAYLNLLQLGQTLPPGISVEECQRGATSMIVNSRAIREEGFNLKNEILRIRKERTLLESGTITSAVVFEFYQKYGEDMKTWIQSGDQAFATFVGSKSEDQKLPANFVGFPTELLKVPTQNATIGEAYRAISEGMTPPPAGKYAYNYGVSFDSATGIYMLSKAAAEGYITLLITPSRAVQENLENGCTTTFSDCNETTTP